MASNEEFFHAHSQSELTFWTFQSLHLFVLSVFVHRSTTDIFSLQGNKISVSLPWGLWRFTDADGTYVATGGSQNLSPPSPLGDGDPINIIELGPSP